MDESPRSLSGQLLLRDMEGGVIIFGHPMPSGDSGLREGDSGPRDGRCDRAIAAAEAELAARHRTPLLNSLRPRPANPRRLRNP